MTDIYVLLEPAFKSAERECNRAHTHEEKNIALARLATLELVEQMAFSELASSASTKRYD